MNKLTYLLFLAIIANIIYLSNQKTVSHKVPKGCHYTDCIPLPGLPNFSAKISSKFMFDNNTL